MCTPIAKGFAGPRPLWFTIVKVSLGLQFWQTAQVDTCLKMILLFTNDIEKFGLLLFCRLQTSLFAYPTTGKVSFLP